MSFNRLHAFLGMLGALAPLVLSGCSLYEGPPPPRVQNFSQGHLGCMTDFNAQLVRYFDGKASVADVNRVADCAVTALRTFGDLVRGENHDRFTGSEVRDFLQRYFLNDVTISDGLLRELMRVKQALLGGKETAFTSEDLKETEDLINVFRDVLLRLQPSMPVSIVRVQTEDAAYVEAETRAIEDVGEILGRRITEKDATYSFDELGRLFDEVSRAFPGSSSTLSGLRNNLKLAGILKETLISPLSPRGTVTAEEWRLTFREGSRWLGNYLKYVNLQSRYNDWTRGDGRARMSVVVNQSIDLFERVVARHCPRGNSLAGDNCRVAPGIPFTLIQEVMQELDWDGSIGGVKIGKGTIEAEIVPLFQHFLGGPDLSPTGRGGFGLTATHLERLRTVLREWIDGSRYVEGLYAKILGTRDFDDNASVSTQAIVQTDVRAVLRENGGVTDSAVAVANGLRETFSHTVALTAPGSPHALFDGKNKSRARIYRELFRYTWLRPALKLAVVGYMAGPDLAVRARHVEHDGLNLAEFTTMIADYWQLLLDTRRVGPGDTAIGDAKSRFREAALFTQASDGNALISIDEGVQLVLLTFSANPLGVEVHDRAIKICPTGAFDDYGELTIEPTCYRKKMFNFDSSNPDTADLWRPFPLLIRLYESLDAKHKADFSRFLETAIRKAGKKPDAYFGSDASGTIPMLFHYIESIFLRFDLNPANPGLIGDGFIDKNEAKAAFPIFQTTLAGLSAMNPSDAKLESFFLYILANGAPPVDDSMGGWTRVWHSAEFLWFHLSRPSFKADRLHLLEVFATLSSPSSPPPPARR